MLWVRGHFWIAELILILNLFNLTSLYFRHSKTPLLVHIPIVSAPYAWNYVAILWDGAAMVNAHSLPARILANITIWGILVLGGFFLLAFKDYTMGIELAVLSLCKCLVFDPWWVTDIPQHWPSLNWQRMSSHSSGFLLSSSWDAYSCSRY